MPGDAAKPAPSGSRFVDIRWSPEVDSTNRRLVELIENNRATEGTVFGADHQTAGRGRRGRLWQAPPGSSLLVSVTVRPPAPALPQLTTVGAALAAATACEAATGFRPALKWPNDLVANKLKLGGILAEVVIPELAVVGLGLNVDWGTEAMPEGATSLRRLVDREVNRENLLAAYLRHLEERLAQMRDPALLPNTLDDFRAACSTLGRRVWVDVGTEQIEGRAAAISDAGHLVVETITGRRELAAGDVVHAAIRLPRSGV